MCWMIGTVGGGRTTGAAAAGVAEFDAEDEVLFFATFVRLTSSVLVFVELVDDSVEANRTGGVWPSLGVCDFFTLSPTDMYST